MLHTDGAVRIQVIGDMVRMDFCNLASNEQGQFAPVITTKFAMTIGAFIKTADIVNDYLGKLEKAGVIKKED